METYLEQSKGIFRFAVPPNRAEVDDHDSGPKNGNPHGRGDGWVPKSDESSRCRLRVLSAHNENVELSDHTQSQQAW